MTSARCSSASATTLSRSDASTGRPRAGRRRGGARPLGPSQIDVGQHEVVEERTTGAMAAMAEPTPPAPTTQIRTTIPFPDLIQLYQKRPSGAPQWSRGVCGSTGTATAGGIGRPRHPRARWPGRGDPAQGRRAPAGMTLSSLQWSVGTKDDLLRELFATINAEIAEIVRTATAGTDGVGPVMRATLTALWSAMETAPMMEVGENELVIASLREPVSRRQVCGPLRRVRRGVRGGAGKRGAAQRRAFARARRTAGSTHGDGARGTGAALPGRWGGRALPGRSRRAGRRVGRPRVGPVKNRSRRRRRAGRHRRARAGRYAARGTRSTNPGSDPGALDESSRSR